MTEPEKIWTCPNDKCEDHLMVFDIDPYINYCANCGTKLDLVILGPEDEDAKTN